MQTGQGNNDRRDETRWCVGVPVDPVRGHLYWTQKGLLREILFVQGNLTEIAYVEVPDGQPAR